MGQTAFAEARRRAAAAEGARVEQADAPIQTPEDEAASVAEIQSQLDAARAEFEEKAKLLEGEVVTTEIQAEVAAAESKVRELEGALAHAEEAQRLAEGKIETGLPEGAKAADGTLGTSETTPADPAAVNASASPADKVDAVTTSTGSKVAEEHPDGKAGASPLEENPADAKPTMANSRADIDAYGKARGIDTKKAANKADALALLG